MLTSIALACVLVVLTVMVHAAGFAALLRIILRSNALAASGFPAVTGLVIGLTCWLILLHLAEIAVWGLCYWGLGCLPDAESALYFSGVTYTTVGYGDLVLSRPWRMLAPIEAMTGVLMWGLSTGLFFAIVHRHIDGWVRQRAAPEDQPPVAQHGAGRPRSLTRPERDS